MKKTHPWKVWQPKQEEDRSVKDYDGFKKEKVIDIKRRDSDGM